METIELHQYWEELTPREKIVMAAVGSIKHEMATESWRRLKYDRKNDVKKAITIKTIEYIAKELNEEERQQLTNDYETIMALVEFHFAAPIENLCELEGVIS